MKRWVVAKFALVMKRWKLVLTTLLLSALAFPQTAWTQDTPTNIVIEVRSENPDNRNTENRSVEVLEKDFFTQRARPSQFTANREGSLRYVGEPAYISQVEREAWIEKCSAQGGRLRDCYKQLQRDAIGR